MSLTVQAWLGPLGGTSSPTTNLAACASVSPPCLGRDGPQAGQERGSVRVMGATLQHHLSGHSAGSSEAATPGAESSTLPPVLQVTESQV